MSNNPLIITAAICGAEVTKADNPAVPYSAQELALEAQRCYEHGARVIHLHVRNEDGSATQSKDVFAKAIAAIKAKVPDVIIQVSTGGAVGMTVDERTGPLDLAPEFCTLTTGTCNFGNDVFENSMPMIEAIAKKANTAGTRIEVEVFDAGFVDNALTLVKKGIIPEPLHFDFVLGVPGAMTGTVDRLEFLLSTIPQNATWTVAGVGRFEMPLAKAAIEKGGHVRVGLEDNIYLSKGVLAQGSWELVKNVAEMAAQAGRPLATHQQARQILGI